MKKMIVLLCVVAFVASTSIFAFASNGPADIKLDEGGKMGTVAFPHAAHQAKVTDCTSCHHSGTDSPKCTTCHGVDSAAPKAKKAFHDQCKGCHKDMGGPTKCKECHVK
ncbi:MAG TPA: cytochrome c3 family protein [Geopsychrobacteraceae bacterium]|nr:cytochrome c3 family protein [Geopsychrobacteraceae bacterium]